MWSLFALAVAAPLTVSANGEMAFDLGFRDVGPLLPAPTAIINGEPALKSDWPMTGAMLVKADIEAYGSTFPITASICSSTLIAPDTVLLAAHCVDEFVLALSLPSPSNIEFGFEQNPDMSAYDFGQRQEFREAASRAVHVVSHPDFDIFSFSTNLGVARNNDIALLFLEEPLLDSELGYLPTAAEAEQIAEGSPVTIVGWGQRDAENPYTAGQKYMGDSVVGELGKWELQIGPEKSDTRKCHGDSGGPTFMAVETDSAVPYRVIGVTSHAYDLTDCAEKGGVDTRVDAFLDWIDEVMVEGCGEDGWRSWCEVEGIVPPPDADGYDAWEVNPNADDGDAASEEEKGGCSTAPAWASGGLVAGVLLLTRRRRAAR